MTDPDELRRSGSAERQACIPAPLRDLHRAILRQFLRTGTPPAAAWITGTAADLGLAATAVADLEAADLVYTADGIVTVAYPFSGTPTGQQVELDGLPAVYAMCAIDALGIPAMAGRDGRITATDPHDDGQVQVTVRGRRWTWTPAGAVAVYGRTAACGTDCGSWEVMCPHTTFHAAPSPTWPPGPGLTARSSASGPPSTSAGTSSARYSAAMGRNGPHRRGRATLTLAFEGASGSAGRTESTLTSTRQTWPHRTP
jgi:hypothetical protein